MSENARVAGRERPRLFVALVLPEHPRDRLVDWQRRELGQVEDIRIVPPDNLHVTIAFLGARPAADVEPILALMREAAACAQKPLFKPIRYRETRSVGMVVCEDAGGRASSLADDLFTRLEKLELDGDRESIRTDATSAALQLLHRHLTQGSTNARE